MDNFIIDTAETVYTPAEDSYMLAENLLIENDQSVLEIGTGSGIVAMYASKLTKKVTATDINYAFDGGLDGRKVIDLFLNEVKNYLNDGGIVQLIQSSLCDNDKTLDILDKQGFVAEIAVSEHFFFEDVVLINGYL